MSGRTRLGDELVAAACVSTGEPAAASARAPGRRFHMRADRFRRVASGRRGPAWWLVGAAVLLLTAVAAGGILRGRATATTALAGTDLGRQPAPDFLLRDSSGQAYSLSRFRGKVVVLAFLYTHCPDVCPFTAELLRKADAAAGHPADIEYIAISVDPFGDNASSIAAFSDDHHLEELGNRFHYLIGSLPELARVWQRYAIRNAGAPEPGQPIDHEASVYLIDKHGLRRRLIPVGTPVAAVARGLQAFARE